MFRHWAWHGVARVESQVEQGCLKLATIHVHKSKVWTDFAVRHDVFANDSVDHGHQVVDERS
jgi:hypothetical protein